MVIWIAGFQSQILQNFIKKSKFKCLLLTRNKENSYIEDAAKKNITKKDIVIYAAGLADIVLSEKNISLSYSINFEQPVKFYHSIVKEIGCRFITFSSASAFGDDGESGLPLSHYGMHKRLLEEFLKIQNDKNILILRLFSVYGPSIKKMMIYQLINRALSAVENNSTLEVYDSGKVFRDLIHEEGITHLLTKAIEDKLFGIIPVISSSKSDLDEVEDEILRIIDPQNKIRKTKIVTNNSLFPKSWSPESNEFTLKYDLNQFAFPYGIVKMINEI